MVRAGLEVICPDLGVGKWRPTPTQRERCIPTKVCTPWTASRPWSRELTNPLCAQTKSEGTHAEGKSQRRWLVPLMADAEAGFGGPLNAFELMKHMIEAGASGADSQDQLAAEKKCGHMGGKVLVPTSQFIRTCPQPVWLQT